MHTGRLNPLFDLYRSFLNPVSKANKLSIATLEAFVCFHLYLLESHINTLMPQMREASEVADEQGLQTFLNHQAESMTRIYSKFMDDTRMLSDLTTHLQTRFAVLLQENLQFVNGQNIQNYQEALESAIKANTLSMAMLEAFTELHLHTLQLYIDLGSRQIKALTHIRGLESLKTFLAHQSDTVSRLRENLLINSQALSEVTIQLGEELDAQLKAYIYFMCWNRRITDSIQPSIIW